MKHFLFIIGLNTIVKIKMGNIGTYENKVTFFISGNAVAQMASAIGTFDLDQFIFWMKIPIEHIV